MKANATKPLLNKRIFWDVNFEALDYNNKCTFIIERVFERGDVDDIRHVRRFYGEEKIKNVLLNAKYLPEARLFLASAVINQPLKSFKCYTLQQLNPGLSPY